MTAVTYDTLAVMLTDGYRWFILGEKNRVIELDYEESALHYQKFRPLTCLTLDNSNLSK